MKKGEIGLVTRNIPSGGLFKDYEEMKIYWKNMYGYILPERECENLYFHVYFRMLGSNPFTYPSCCLQLYQPLQVPFIPQKAEEYLVRFLQDLQMQIPTVCGEQWLDKANLYRPRLYLQSAGTDVDHFRSENQNSLTEKIQSKIPSNRPSYDTTHSKASQQVIPDILKLPEVEPQTKNSTGESTSGSCNPRFNLFQRGEPVQRTPYVPSFAVAAAFGSSQQPRLNFTPTNCPVKQLPSAKNSSFDANVVPVQREVVKTVSEQPKSSPIAVQNKMVRDDSTKTSKAKPKEFSEDIVLLAQKNKLSKVSNVNLLRWLKEMGVPCSTKLRKPELINKVTKFVEMSAPEQ